MNHTITAKQWVAVIDRLYYPDMTYFQTEAEASEFCEKLIKENHAAGGKYKTLVYVALITRGLEISTEH